VNLYDRAVAYFDSEQGVKRAIDRAKIGMLNSTFRSDYQHSPETRNRGASRLMNWARSWRTSIGSGTSDLPKAERNTLIARSRDAYRGHTIARAAITRCRTNIVGTGLIPHASVDAEALGITEENAKQLNEILDREYRIWAENPVECDAEATLDFYGQQALTLISAMLSGDCFALTPFEERPGCVYGTKIQLIEADRVSNKDNAPNSRSLIDGIELSPLGMPLRIHIQRSHPGDTVDQIQQWDIVPVFGAETGRRRVLHIWNDKDRIGQVRGAPYLTPILEPLQKLEKFASAELMAAVVASMFTVFIKKPAEVAGVDGSPLGAFETTTTNTAAGDTSPTLEMGSGAIVDLGPGEEPAFADPTRPNAQFDPFFMAVMKQIGAALELPVDELLLHYQSSYSAARAAMLQAWRFYTMRRWWLVQQFCAPARALWLDEAVARGRIPVTDYADPVRRAAYGCAIWVGPARGAMDEEKEANAAKTRIEIGVSNRAIECASMTGEDLGSVDAQRRREIAADAVSGSNEAMKAASDTYGVAVRAGAITPQVEDEEAFRIRMGLPPLSDEARAAWTADGGARRPITLQQKSEPAAPDPNTEDGLPPSPADALLTAAVDRLTRVSASNGP
jgi:lambda family phage portal protein